MYYHRAERISNHSSPILLPVFFNSPIIYQLFSFVSHNFVNCWRVGIPLPPFAPRGQFSFEYYWCVFVTRTFLFQPLGRANGSRPSIIGAYSPREWFSSSLLRRAGSSLSSISALIRRVGGSLPPFAFIPRPLFFPSHQQGAACSEAVQKAIKKPSGGG